MAHLEDQVCGDGELREELLRLYASRLEVSGPKLQSATGVERRELAHGLKGASLAVGAFALARLCGRIETAELHEGVDARELSRLVEATRVRVAELLCEAWQAEQQGDQSASRPGD